eukprot:3602690-Prymnesium_polylepis.1
MGRNRAIRAILGWHHGAHLGAVERREDHLEAVGSLLPNMGVGRVSASAGASGQGGALEQRRAWGGAKQG